jgi:excisionase family DNA binding protein
MIEEILKILRELQDQIKKMESDVQALKTDSGRAADPKPMNSLEASRFLGVSTIHLYRMVKDGRLRAQRLGKRKWMFLRQDLIDMQQNKKLTKQEQYELDRKRS